MNPLSALYGAAIQLRNLSYDRGWREQKRLQWPVVSVGNLRAGGAGKTPFTILLGELLQQRKMAFDVLSRGYGREGTAVKLVEASGSARTFGDEPLLIAQRLQVPVVVGADRYAAGVFSEKMFAGVLPAHGGWLHLLDDGFQHRRLLRDFDIVLVTPGDFSDALLPVGRLREPLAALARADAIVLVEGASPDRLPASARDKIITKVMRKLDAGASPLPQKKNTVAFCGIARPQRFFEDLKLAGVELAAMRAFPDHHRYSAADAEELEALRRRSGAEILLTTEKDAINLRSSNLWEQLQPVRAVGLRMELADAAGFMDALLAAVARHDGRT